MKIDEDNKVEREAFIQAVERMVLQYQCIDFNEWHYWRNILQELDPYNPLPVSYTHLTLPTIYSV